MRRWLRVSLCAGLAILAVAARAELNPFTDIQLLSGGRFRDHLNGNATAGGAMTTVALEHGGAWAYGDNFFAGGLNAGSDGFFADLAGLSVVLPSGCGAGDVRAAGAAEMDLVTA